MKSTVKVFAFMLLLSIVASAQDGFQGYHRQTDLLLSSPGSLRYGLNGFENPAMLSYVKSFDFTYTWTDQNRLPGDAMANTEYNRWGTFMGWNNFGFGAHHESLGDAEVTDYRISFAGGDKTFSTGFSYGWSNGNRAAFDRTSIWNAGLLFRPLEYVSLGAVFSQQVGGSGQQAVVDVAARPFGNEWLTFFGDFAVNNNQHLKDGNWSAGAVVEVIPGLRIAGRYFDSEWVTMGAQISLGGFGYSYQSHMDNDSKHQYATHSIRFGDQDRNFFERFSPGKKYLQMDMKGSIAYQRYIWFDSRSTLFELLERIEAAKNDPSIDGIAMNLSAMRTNKEFIWELRQKLLEFKAADKKVVAYLDRANIDLYHLASVCDKIIMDPQGMITLEGYILGRTYLKGTLEKIGVGFDEWRFFKYKSAYETYSRESMSEGDREQRQELVDDWYELAKNDICSGRGFSGSEFDSFVDGTVIFDARTALENNLVDTLCRWEAVNSVLEKMEDASVSYTGPSMLKDFVEPYDAKWGEEPKIAIIYALGACAMDEGIRARSLVKVVKAVAADRSIDAVVFRVDSPGGDGMASDIVAEALKECKNNGKPVIVSQGYVAASGGYWLSMYADTIVAAPNTITGSIGVIGGWIYNKSLKEELGMSTDHVKKGSHADLMFGVTLPLLGLRIPDRNLNEDEHVKMERYIKNHYEDFVGKVASGRNMDTSDVKEIAQGRVWSGVDGKENGLVDILGGLYDAIRIAKARAGIEKDERITILQYPDPELFDFSMLMPSLVGVDIESDPVLRNLKFRLENNGSAMPILPMEDWDETILNLETEMLD
jgi:protease IV